MRRLRSARIVRLVADDVGQDVHITNAPSVISFATIQLAQAEPISIYVSPFVPSFPYAHHLDHKVMKNAGVQLSF